MSVTTKFLLGIGGAVVLAAGVSTSASAQVVAAGTGACEAYAQEYAAVHAPQFGLGGWDGAYRFAYNECITGGPSFVTASPYGWHPGPLDTLGNVLAAPLVAGTHIAGSALHAGAHVAGSALHAGASLAGAALAVPGTVLGGTAAALAPPATAALAPPAPQVSATAEPVVIKNYHGTFEEPPVTAVAGPGTTTTAALAVPADAATPPQFTPEWYAYCAAKYNSFDPDTGMYLAYSGTYRMCQ